MPDCWLRVRTRKVLRPAIRLAAECNSNEQRNVGKNTEILDQVDEQEWTAFEQAIGRDGKVYQGLTGDG